MCSFFLRCLTIALCKSEAELNKLCAVVWNHRDRLNWYVGYVTSKNGESFSVEHLERVGTNNVYWRYPDPPEELDILLLI